MDRLINPHEEIEAIDLRALFAKLVAKRWWIVGSVVGFMIVFTTAAFIQAPVYRAQVILVPVASERGGGGLGAVLGQLGGLASIAGMGLGSANSETEEALAVLRSRQFTEKFIQDRQLMPKLFAAKWDATRNTWKVPKHEQPTPQKAYRRFDEKIRTVLRDKRTGLITVQINWTDRNEAAAWANELADRLNQEMRRRAIADADASVGFLEKELHITTTVPTREAIGRLIEAQVKQRMLATVTNDYAFRVVDKAMPPDIDSPVKPQKPMMIVAGFVVGLLAGVFGVLLFGWLRPQKSG